MNDRNKQIGKKIKIARILAEITQEELAKKIEVGPVTVSRIESGSKNTTAIEIEKISKVFNRPLSYFYEEKEEEYQEVDNLRANFEDLDKLIRNLNPKDLELTERVVSQIREIKREKEEPKEVTKKGGRT